jgi:hypothetical protein
LLNFNKQILEDNSTNSTKQEKDKAIQSLVNNTYLKKNSSGLDITIPESSDEMIDERVPLALN